jgi:hypothetical protein
MCRVHLKAAMVVDDTLIFNYKDNGFQLQMYMHGTSTMVV